jgi:hypothetical protein
MIPPEVIVVICTRRKRMSTEVVSECNNDGSVALQRRRILKNCHIAQHDGNSECKNIIPGAYRCTEGGPISSALKISEDLLALVASRDRIFFLRCHVSTYMSMDVQRFVHY